MPAFLAPLLLKLPAIKAFVKANAASLVFMAIAVALIASALFLYQRGRSAGGNEVRVEVQKEKIETIREVRNDEALAQQVADQTGAALANTIAAQTADTDQKLKEITDALNARPALPAGCPVDVAPDGVRNASNALVARANRAASPSAAARRADPDGND